MYVVLDLETSSKEMYSRKANHLYNHILCIGLKYQSKDVIALPQDYMPKGWLDNVDLLIIHNASFDLKFIFNNEDLLEFYKRDGRVWCTANAEFILSKQQHKFPALRDIAVNKYGRPFREKNIEKFFESGLETTDADISLLLTDVTNDVLDTEEIAKQQIKKSKENGMFNLINARMDSLLATVEIETNGIKIDREVFLKNKTQLEGQLEL
jgi:DNA polymerase I-like protein with 3'-5' exonuclease and polymerase domains